MYLKKDLRTIAQTVGAGLSRDCAVRSKKDRGINPLLQQMLVIIYTVSICLLGISTAFADNPIQQAQDKPNIVFVLVDDHAWEAVSAYGSYLKNYATTPTIDSLGRDGMRFDNFVCANSICSPSRASFITGQYSHVNGVKNLNGKINDTSPWLSEELQKGGYETMLVGKWHLQ